MNGFATDGDPPMPIYRAAFGRHEAIEPSYYAFTLSPGDRRLQRGHGGRGLRHALASIAHSQLFCCALAGL